MNLVYLRPLKSPAPSFAHDIEEPIRAELFSIERLEQHGESLRSRSGSPTSREPDARWRRGFGTTRRVLLEAYRSIAAAIREERSITPAAEWLVDNFHVVEEQIREIRDDLPPRLLSPTAQACRRPAAGISAGVRNRVGIRRAYRQPLRPADALPVRAGLSARAAIDDRRAVGGRDHAQDRAGGKSPPPGRAHRGRSEQRASEPTRWPTGCSASAAARRSPPRRRSKVSNERRCRRLSRCSWFNACAIRIPR